MIWSGKKVCVTGGAGFIGLNLANELNRLGAKVTVIDKNKKPFVYLKKEISAIRVDITKKELMGVDNKYEYVFHLAARTDINSSNVEDYYENFEGTQKVLKWLDKKALKRFIFYSTQLVVGLHDTKRVIDKNEPYWSKTAYGKSKIIAEQIVRKSNTPFTIIRPTSIFGAYGGEPYRDFFLMIKNHRYFHIGKADNLVSMCYVKNLIDLTLLLAEKKEAVEGIFYGSDLKPYTQRQFADEAARYFSFKLMTIPDLIAYPAAYFLGVLKYFGVDVPLYPFRLRNIKASYCYDMSDCEILGYKPKYDLKRSIEETLNWYTKNDNEFKK